MIINLEFWNQPQVRIKLKQVASVEIHVVSFSQKNLGPCLFLAIYAKIVHSSYKTLAAKAKSVPPNMAKYAQLIN